MKTARLQEHDAWSSPGFLLWHATLSWQREVAAALKPLGLTHVQFVLLGSLWWLSEHHGPPSQRELAEHAGTDVMMTSQVVRTLERRGLLERMPDADDGRKWRLLITPAGTALAEEGVERMLEVDESFFAAGGSPAAIVAMLRGLAGRDAQGRPTGTPPTVSTA